MKNYSPGNYTQIQDPKALGKFVTQELAKISDSINLANQDITADEATIAGLGAPPAAASKADQQTGTSATKFVAPAHQQDHDSSAKAWVSITGATGAILASYNVSGVVRNSTGDYTISFTVPFASAHYACNCTNTSTGSPTGFAITDVKTKLAVSVEVASTNTATGVAQDQTTLDVVCFGRQ